MTHHHSQTFHNAGWSSLSLEGGNTVFSLFIRHCLIKYPTSLVTFGLLKYSTSSNILFGWINLGVGVYFCCLCITNSVQGQQPFTLTFTWGQFRINNSLITQVHVCGLWEEARGFEENPCEHEEKWNKCWWNAADLWPTNQQNKFLHIIIIILCILWKDDWASFIHSS